MRTNYGDDKDTMWDNCVLDVVMHGEKMRNLGISFPGNVAFGGKYLQFWGEIYHLDGYFGLFLPNISENL